MKLKDYLNILQLEMYDTGRFMKWVREHKDVERLEGKKPVVWTNKARVIYWMAWGLWPITILAPEWGLVAATVIIKPVEEMWRERIINRAKEKIDRLKKGKLKVIGIAGSFGKTSTKEFLYQILKTNFRVVRTPESYNTPLGIAKVIDMELDESCDFFICEMGEHKQGDIKELCEMVLPDYGIITGMNEQHLERFGSREEIRRTIYELKDYVSKVVEYKKGKGNPMEENLRAARKMAEILGVKAEVGVKPVEHRLKVIERGELTIIDDAYSSNVDGFGAAVTYLKSFAGWKAIVTPGIAELGEETFEIHRNLGELLKGIDQVILVGRSERTEGLVAGASKGEFIEKVGEAIGRVEKRPAVVLFENDLPDNY